MMNDLTIHINWLSKFKEENKISYEKLGESIGYSGVGINKAIKNNTLSINQIIEIANRFNKIENLNEYVSQNKGLTITSEMTDDELSLFILKNKDRILNNEVMALLIESIAIKKAKEILVNDLKSKI